MPIHIMDSIQSRTRLRQMPFLCVARPMRLGTFLVLMTRQLPHTIDITPMHREQIMYFGQPLRNQHQPNIFMCVQMAFQEQAPQQALIQRTDYALNI